MTSEEEQIKQLKQWWDDNGVSTIVSILVAVALVFGWQGWQRSQQAKSDAAAIAYEELIMATQAALESPDDIKIAQATFLANEIKEQHSDSGYAYFSAFLLARQAVADKDYETAEAELRGILSQQSSPEVEQLAQYRLARVLYAAERYPEALAGLPEAKDTAFAPLFAEAKGDILLAQKKYQEAYDAYSESKQLAESLELQQPELLTIKLQYARSYL